MPIFFGNKKIVKIYFGNKKINKVQDGSKIVWQGLEKNTRSCWTSSSTAYYKSTRTGEDKVTGCGWSSTDSFETCALSNPSTNPTCSAGATRYTCSPGGSQICLDPMISWNCVIQTGYDIISCSWSDWSEPSVVGSCNGDSPACSDGAVQVQCESFESYSCICSDWSGWSSTSSCTKQYGTGECSGELIVDCR